MDPVAIIDTAFQVAMVVKQLLDDNAEAKEVSEDLSEMIQVHIIILENIRHVKNVAFAIIIKQYSKQIENLRVELEKRQGKGMFKKLKSFFGSEAFLGLSAALEEKMMKIQVTLLTVIGTSNGASPSPTAAGAPAQQTMGDAPAVEMQAVEVTMGKDAAGVPAPAQQVAAAAQVVPAGALESGVEPVLSEADLAAIRGSLNAENMASIKAVPVRKRGHIFCHDIKCGKMHPYDLTFSPLAKFGSCCCGPIFVCCCISKMSPELSYVCTKDGQQHVVKKRQCGECDKAHTVRVESTFKDICPACIPYCGICIMLAMFKGKPYYEHAGKKVLM